MKIIPVVKPPALTDKEWELVRFAARYYYVCEPEPPSLSLLARRMNVSKATIRNRVKSINEKIGRPACLPSV